MINFVMLGRQIICPNVYHSLCHHVFWPPKIFPVFCAFTFELWNAFISILFDSLFFQMAVFRLSSPFRFSESTAISVLQNAEKYYWYWKSCVIREWSYKATRVNACVCASCCCASAFPALLAPMSKPGNEHWIPMPDRWDLPWEALLCSKIFCWELEGRISK